MSKRSIEEEVSQNKKFKHAFPKNFEFSINYHPSAPKTIIHQCRDYLGKYYHINIDKFVEIECLWEKMPLYFNDEINTAPDGVYTWVLILSESYADEGVPSILAYRVLTTHEIGTKHADILARIRSQVNEGDYDNEELGDEDIIEEVKLLGSGEFIKRGNNLQINFISGTYMLRHFTSQNMSPNEIKQMISKLARETKVAFNYLTNLNVTEEINASTYITETNIRLNANDLSLLLSCGAQIRKFNNKNDCLAFKEYIKEELENKNYDDIEVPKEFIGKFEEENEESVKLIGGYLQFIRENTMKKTKRRKFRSKTKSKSKKFKSKLFAN